MPVDVFHFIMSGFLLGQPHAENAENAEKDSSITIDAYAKYIQETKRMFTATTLDHHSTTNSYRFVDTTLLYSTLHYSTLYFYFLYAIGVEFHHFFLQDDGEVGNTTFDKSASRTIFCSLIVSGRSLNAWR